MNQTTEKKCPSCGKKYKKRSRGSGCLIVLATIGGLAVLLIILFVVVLGGAASQLDREQKAHAITREKFDSVQLGWTEQQVIQHVGREPENRQEFNHKDFLNNEPQDASCIYYNKEGGSFGDVFQFCFTNGTLDSKNAYTSG